ncbi:uncharacterized protein [Salminus brasiliensis]|uniref:uncharacterized protein n=1 Tax=Salminus brasiliensis TaxID=930266 RepID=UPI003B835FF6
MIILDCVWLGVQQIRPATVQKAKINEIQIFLLQASTTAWFKQTPGEKPLLIASAYHSTAVVYHGSFYEHGRFIAIREKSQPVQLGGNTTLQCSILTNNSAEDHSAYWFRHGSGDSHPGIIYTHGNRSDQCEKSSETGSLTQSCVYKLPKRNLSASDAGTYYCAVAACGEILFGNGTKLDFVDSVQLGGNTTLQCSILTDNSVGDHSVYWFRHGSGESYPGIIYTHGNRSDQCEKSSETGSPTQSCIYKLPKRNLSLSDAGTYYCAVAACGEILFGNGTNLYFQGSAADCTVKVNQVACNETLKFAVGRFTNKPHQITEDPDVYSHVIYY